jgi:hypothetical protein
MKRLICVVIVVLSLFIGTKLGTSYMDGPYVPEYPCVIMETPYVRYILHKPGGNITAEHKQKEVHHE